MDKIVKGVTTVVWGTSGRLTGALSGCVVASISFKSKAEVVELDDNDGFTDTEVLLRNGFDAEVKARYDTAKTWPAEGDTVQITHPRLGSLNCLLASIDDDLSKKQEAMVTMALHYRPNRTL